MKEAFVRPDNPDFELKITEKDDGTWEHRGVDDMLLKLRATHLYAHKSSSPDPLHTSKLPTVCNVLHFMFRASHPIDGDCPMKISDSVRGPVTTVALSVEQPNPEHLKAPDMRQELGIPESATVIARFGGQNSFDIRCVQDAVCRVAKSSPNIYFLFANTMAFHSKCEAGVSNIIFLPSVEGVDKTRFIKTSDAMLHARGGGESFGIAVGEFSVMNKPVFTTRTAGDRTAQLAHVNILGDKALLYTCEDVETKLKGFDRYGAVSKDWNAYRDYDAQKQADRILSLCTGWTPPKPENGRSNARATCPGGTSSPDGTHCVCPSGSVCHGSHCTHGQAKQSVMPVSGYSTVKCPDCVCALK